ncbi:MAG: hypothetical protein IJ599_02140 [Alphaproteobacteria bacterium]|nr:hypothetical protein [Alphaproteobacteria bacterium]
MLISVPPRLSTSKVVQYVKGKDSRICRRLIGRITSGFPSSNGLLFIIRFPSVPQPASFQRTDHLFVNLKFRLGDCFGQLCIYEKINILSNVNNFPKHQNFTSAITFHIGI